MAKSLVRQEATRYPGVYRRTYSDGSTQWRRIWREGGRGSAQRSRNFGSLAEARAFDPTAPEDVPKRATTARTVDYYGKRWLATLGGMKPYTVAGYTSRWKCHVQPRFGAVRVDAVTWPDVQVWLSDLALAGYSESQRKLVYFALRAVLDVAVDEGAIPANPCVGRRRTPRVGAPAKGERVPLDAEQVDVLAGEVGANYELLVRVLAYSGIRIGEALALRVAALDEVHNVVRISVNQSEAGGVIREHSTKSGKSRVVQVPPSLMALLVKHVRRNALAPDARVFTSVTGRPVRARDFREHVLKPAVSRLIARGTFPATLAGFTTHDMRHTYTALAKAAGVHPFEIQRQLGHAHMAMTLGYEHAGRVGDVSAALDVAYRRAAS